MGTIDNMIIRYASNIMGYTILGLPVFGNQVISSKIAAPKRDSSSLTGDYIRNSSLLINLSKAIGRILASYKDVQNLAGYTYLIYDVNEVLLDLEKGNYVRTSVINKNNEIEKSNINAIKTGSYHKANYIKFEDISIVTPNGDVLVENMNFTIKPGHNCIISGPNGCGKSSLFRILGELWPLVKGNLYRPPMSKLFYIPQRPYLPNGTLLDQVIYPHISIEDGHTEEDICNILKEVQLGALLLQTNGLYAKNNWQDVLSGGEKQRMAMARLFYHKPEFAI